MGNVSYLPHSYEIIVMNYVFVIPTVTPTLMTEGVVCSS